MARRPAAMLPAFEPGRRMFKDILVPFVGGELRATAVEGACALARAGGGRLSLLVGLSAITPVVAA